MGQYWIPVNLDKKEFIHPHRLGTGLKLWEQLANPLGTGAALIILQAAMPYPRGGGDLNTHEGVVGRWAGDRVVLIGDYAEKDDIPGFEGDASLIYDQCRSLAYEEPPGEYTDISDMVCAVIESELGGKYEGDGWRSFVRG